MNVTKSDCGGTSRVLALQFLAILRSPLGLRKFNRYLSPHLHISIPSIPTPAVNQSYISQPSSKFITTAVCNAGTSVPQPSIRGTQIPHLCDATTSCTSTALHPYFTRKKSNLHHSIIPIPIRDSSIPSKTNIKNSRKRANRQTP